jgi:hypothetical protein
MVQAGDGKFRDPVLFLQNRFLEVGWLVTGLLLVALGITCLGKLVARRMPRLWQWVPFSILGVIGLNLWIRMATATCLFWCVFWNGKGTTDNLTQFHIKVLLMDETPAANKVILAGSSQVHAQIDPRILSRQLGSNFLSTELHFPGNRGYDFLFLNQELAGHKADTIVCYLSESNFFLDGFAPGFPLFFRLDNLPEFYRLGGKAQWLPHYFGYAVLGNVLPVFYLRDPLAQRFIGNGIIEVHKRVAGSSSAEHLRQVALEMSRTYRTSDQSRFQMAAFELFVARCQAQHQKLVLCCGQLNPILEAQLDPALRPQMISYLRQLAARYDNVLLLEEKALPVQTPDDYDDLTHVNRAAQIQFTEFIGRTLQTLSSSSARGPGRIL